MASTIWVMWFNLESEVRDVMWDQSIVARDLPYVGGCWQRGQCAAGAAGREVPDPAGETRRRFSRTTGYGMKSSRGMSRGLAIFMATWAIAARRIFEVNLVVMIFIDFALRRLAFRSLVALVQ